jgi:hypothetical protein
VQIAGIMADRTLRWPLNTYKTASLLELSTALHDMTDRVDRVLGERVDAEAGEVTDAEATEIAERGR